MIKIIPIDIYFVSIVVAIEPTIEEWRNFRKKNKRNITDDDEKIFLRDFESPDTCNGSTFFLSGGDYMIFVRHKYHGDIAHEIFHACNSILVERGFTHDVTAEPWAYLIGYVTDAVYDLLEEKR